MINLFDGHCHKKAVIHVLFHAVIALVPLTAVVVMLLYGEWKGMFFLENGEFYIYSVVFSSMSLYALVSLGLKKDDWGILVILWTVLCLIFSLILYGSLIHGKVVVSAAGKPPVEKFLESSSWVLLTLSLITFYISTYWEIYRENVARTGTDDRESIENLKMNLS